MTNLALDRIASVSNSNEDFIPNDLIDFKEYFDDFIGVTKASDENLIKMPITSKI